MKLELDMFIACQQIRSRKHHVDGWHVGRLARRWLGNHPFVSYSSEKKACGKGWQLFLTCLDSEVSIKVASTTYACRSWKVNLSSSSLSIRHFFDCGNMLRLALTFNHRHFYDFVAAKTSNKVWSPFQAEDLIIYESKCFWIQTLLE